MALASFRRQAALVLCLMLVFALVPLVPVKAATLFYDDFNDGNANGWTPQANYNDWSVVLDNGNYVYFSSSTNEGRTSAGNQSWTDYSVQAKVKVENFNGSNRAYVSGRYQNGNNYYAASLTGGNKLELIKKVGGTTSTLVSKNYTLSTGTWYTVKLEMQGSTLKMYVNGNLELQATDSSLSSGGIGLVARGTVTKYDDVLVTTNDGSTGTITVTSSHTINRSSTNPTIRYANSLKLNILDMLDAVEWDSGIVRNGTTFTNTLTTPGGASNRNIRIGFKNGQGIMNLTALNNSAGEVGVHLDVGIDVSQTTNGMYLALRNDGLAPSGYISGRYHINWQDYNTLDTIIPLYTTMWNANKAYIEITLPYNSSINIKNIYLYLETTVYGFGDMHSRITGGTGASSSNTHVVNNASQLATALNAVANANGAPSIIYINGTITHTAWGSRVINLGKNIRNLSIIGAYNRGVLDGVGITVQGHNVIIENLTIQYVQAGDGVQVNNGTDVWIRHNTFIDGGRDLPEGQRFDEFTSVKNLTQGVIISWNRFLNGNRVLLVGSNDDMDAMPDRKVIFHHNYIENVTQRIPLYRGGHAHVYNNYFKNVNSYAVGARFNSKVRVENNYFDNVKNPIQGDGGLYQVSGNTFVNSTGSMPTSSTVTINFQNYSYQLDPTNQVPSIVSNGAGAGKIQQNLPF